jgi:cathepsin X
MIQLLGRVLTLISFFCLHGTRNGSSAQTQHQLQQKKRFNEFKVMPGHNVKNDYSSPLPHTYIDPSTLPSDFSWNNVNGTCYLTHVLNQHIPQYCGSCWAHGALSAFADRVKISRKAKGPDINFSIQYILNCGTETAGSCHGGSATGVYQFISESGNGVPFDTCQPYIACSEESKEGFCLHANTQCTPENTCVTCNSFSGFPFKGKCTAIYNYPNCTIGEYGTLPMDADSIKAEIYARGPVPAGVNANAIVVYKGELIDEDYVKAGGWDDEIDHIVSIVGWKTNGHGKQFWIVRNSWGAYWGDLGFFYVELGLNLLGIESEVSWATPGICTERNFPCDEDGENCAAEHHTYIDPSVDLEALLQRRFLFEA